MSKPSYTPTPSRERDFIEDERLKDADEFLHWQAVNSKQIKAAEQRAERTILDAVMRAVIAMRLQGATVEDAGDYLLRTFDYGTRDKVCFTPGAVRRALQGIGWVPKRDRDLK